MKSIRIWSVCTVLILWSAAGAFFLPGCDSGGVQVVTGGDKSPLPLINITNADLADSDDRVFLGIAGTYTINWEAASVPEGGTVKLFLAETFGVDDAGTLVEITPDGGVDVGDDVEGGNGAKRGQFAFTPSEATFADKTGRHYYVLVKLIGIVGTGQVPFADSFSRGTIYIGEGGVNILSPAADATISMGEQVTVTWELTGDICSRQLDKRKILRLYVDVVPTYRGEDSTEVSGDDGIDVCLGEPAEFTFASDRFMKEDRQYYVIARLFLEGNVQEEMRAVSPGRISIIGVGVNVLSPKDDVTENLQSVHVAWETVNIDVTGKKVNILAVRQDEPAQEPQEDMILVPEYQAAAGWALVDMSRLPPGTYKVRVRLFETDADNQEISRGSGESEGRVVVPDGYRGPYDLADMAAAADRNYSPVDGTIFEGFNIGDWAGYDAATVGDTDGDGLSDFLIFTRFGHEYTTGDAGSAYLIYGGSGLPPIVDLNGIASPDAESRPVEGTLMLMPMENLSTVRGQQTYGRFSAIGMPDISADDKSDLMIGCPEAAPLEVWFTNTSGGDLTITDHYGLERTIPGNSVTYIEPSHVHSFMTFNDQDGGVYPLFFPADYHPGDIIDVEIVASNLLSITVQSVGANRGTVYLVTSERLAIYRNRVFDLAQIGSPSEKDGLDGLAQGQMLVWSPWFVSDRFGADLSVLPDRDGDGAPEFLISAPEDTVVDTSNADYPSRPRAGMALVFGAEYRWDSLPFVDGGHIAWGFSGTAKNSSARGTFGDSSIVNIFGAEENATLTGIAGLGRFTDLTDYSSYSHGDFNADSIPDIVAGSPGENGERGAIYVLPVRPVFGHRVESIDLADFNKPIPPGGDPGLEVPILGVKLVGTVEGERLGGIVEPTGDFNGDGLADVMFALPGSDGADRAEAGRVVIMFGQEGVLGDFTLDDVNSQIGTALPGLIFEGQNVGDRFGERICAVYDVNADGVDDILVAAPAADGPGKNDCGKIYLIYGKRNIIKSDPSTGFKFVDYDGNDQPDEAWSVQAIGVNLPGAVFLGEAADDQLQAISPAGDVNGDGIGDFLIGAPYADVSSVQQNAGKAYLILGR